MPFRKPPGYLKDLTPQSTGKYEIDLRPPTGLMESFLGQRFSVNEIWEAYCNQCEDCDDPQERKYRKLAKLVRAFEVPALIGVIFSAENQYEVGSSLHQLLTEFFSGIPWDPFTIYPGALQKYEIFHTSIPAPMDETTGEAMGLEVYGYVVRIHEPTIDSVQFRKIYKTAKESGVTITLDHFRPLELELRVATYANIEYPSIGIPFYM